MAKRLTDTEKWKKPFIRSLPVEYKVFWLYILDDCDHAGVWQVDIEIAEIKLGTKLSLEKARGLFTGKVVEFDNGTKWFIPDFVAFQYGELSEKNKMYKSVTLILNRYNLMGHLSSIYGGKVQDKDKVKDKVEGGVGETTEFRIEECLRIAMNDSRWVKANQATETEVLNFNTYLEKQGIYAKNPLDYKRYFAKLKGRYPAVLKQELTIEELRRIAQEMDKSAS